MKSLHPFIAIVCVLMAPPAKGNEKPGAAGGEQGLSKNGKEREQIDVRTLLEKGRASGSWPEGLIIRISACLGELDQTASGGRGPVELREAWEFTSGEVRRIGPEDEADKSSARLGDSRPFASNGLCQDLLEGRAIEIQAGKGEGPEVGLIGSHYHRGGRSIEVVWKGEAILHLYETNGPFLKFYRETDARAFASLYERLASQARVLFKSNPVEKK